MEMLDEETDGTAADAVVNGDMVTGEETRVAYETDGTAVDAVVVTGEGKRPAADERATAALSAGVTVAAAVGERRGRDGTEDATTRWFAVCEAE